MKARSEWGVRVRSEGEKEGGVRMSGELEGGVSGE